MLAALQGQVLLQGDHRELAALTQREVGKGFWDFELRCAVISWGGQRCEAARPNP